MVYCIMLYASITHCNVLYYNSRRAAACDTSGRAMLSHYSVVIGFLARASFVKQQHDNYDNNT